MTDVTLIEGKIVEWELGDVFIIKSDDGERFSFFFPSEVSPERTTLLDAMQHRNKVKIVVQVEDVE